MKFSSLTGFIFIIFLSTSSFCQNSWSAADTVEYLALVDHFDLLAKQIQKKADSVTRISYGFESDTSLNSHESYGVYIIQESANGLFKVQSGSFANLSYDCRNRLRYFRRNFKEPQCCTLPATISLCLGYLSDWMDELDTHIDYWKDEHKKYSKSISKEKRKGAVYLAYTLDCLYEMRSIYQSQIDKLTIMSLAKS